MALRTGQADGDSQTRPPSERTPASWSPGIGRAGDGRDGAQPTESRDLQTPRRWAAVAGVVVACALLGAVVAGLGIYAHLMVVGGARLPVGVVLALLVLVGAMVTVRALGVATAGRLSMAVGWWAFVLAVGTTPRREGDLLMVVNTQSVVWLLAGSAVLMLGALMPLSSRRAAGRRR